MYYRPSLKNSVDVQLQTAFTDGNWAVAIRLADKRAKILNDPYFEVVKACAESQLDGPLEKCAAFISADQHVRKGTVFKDPDVLELYEWACRDLVGVFSYCDTIGALRTRWVKANPRSPSATQCLRACIQNWDLVNAQQIAVILDKGNPPTPSNRHYLYWSIVLTYLLSNSPQCPPDKQKIYRLLSQKQLERVAEQAECISAATASGNGEGHSADRSLRTEEEILLYYRVMAHLAPVDDYGKLVKSPALGALIQFNNGRKHLLHEVIAVLEHRGQWQTLYDCCLHALSRKNGDGSPSFLASDVAVWRRLIVAARLLPDSELALGRVQALLESFVEATAKATASPMHAKNIALALLDLTFSLVETPPSSHPIDAPGGNSETMRDDRAVHLGLFLEQHGDKTSAFDDVRRYFENLQPHASRRFLDDWAQDKRRSGQSSADLESLLVKLRYLLASNQATQSPSLPLASEPDASTLATRFRDISLSALDALLRRSGGNANDTPAVGSLDRHRSSVDLALVSAMSLLKQAGLLPGSTRHPKIQSLTHPHLFFQAVLLLDAQLRQAPDNPPLRLLLARLYLLLGCASKAYKIWSPLGVKRTIQDSLSPLFFDRISSVSPGLFAGPRPVMEPLRSYYTHSLREPSPVKIWDALSAGSYSAVLDMADYDDSLRRSCTLVMTVVEERRAARALGGRLEDLDFSCFNVEITDDTLLATTIDYGSVPDFEASSSPSMAKALGIGPPPSVRFPTQFAPVHDALPVYSVRALLDYLASITNKMFFWLVKNTRSHLALLSEELLQLCTPPVAKDHRPSKPSDAASLDLMFVKEKLASLHTSLSHFLHLPDTSVYLTDVEESYYGIATIFSDLLLQAMTSRRSDAVPSTVGLLISSIIAALKSLRSAFLIADSPVLSPHHLLPAAPTWWQLTDPHTMSTYRDAAVMVKLGVSLAMAHHDREVASDKSGKSGMHKDMVSHLKVLDKLAGESLDLIGRRIQGLKTSLGGTGPSGSSWLDCLLEWTFGLEEGGRLDALRDNQARALLKAVGGRRGAEEWAGEVLESWTEGVKGWATVCLRL